MNANQVIGAIRSGQVWDIELFRDLSGKDNDIVNQYVLPKYPSIKDFSSPIALIEDTFSTFLAQSAPLAAKFAQASFDEQCRIIQTMRDKGITSATLEQLWDVWDSTPTPYTVDTNGEYVEYSPSHYMAQWDVFHDENLNKALCMDYGYCDSLPNDIVYLTVEESGYLEPHTMCYPWHRCTYGVTFDDSMELYDTDIVIVWIPELGQYIPFELDDEYHWWDRANFGDMEFYCEGCCCVTRYNAAYESYDVWQGSNGYTFKLEFDFKDGKDVVMCGCGSHDVTHSIPTC